MPDNVTIYGGRPLFGDVEIHGAKNAVLPMMAGALLADEPVTILDCPRITDVDDMISILQSLDVCVHRNDRSITICGKPIHGDISVDLSNKMRSSTYMLGVLLSEVGRVRLYSTGGCKIGARPLDIHIDGLSAMGARITQTDEYIECERDRLQGATFKLKYPSVGATENLLFAAVKAEGESVLIGCACEPEILSVCDFLRSMGAKIRGDGTPVIRVEGVQYLNGCVVKPIADRIVGATVLSAVAICGGRVRIQNCNLGHLSAVKNALTSSRFFVYNDGVDVIAEGYGVPYCFDVTTGPYPLFPTDVQPIVMGASIFCAGQSSFNETVFENRYMHASEFAKLGAITAVSGRTATVSHGRLHGGEVTAYDLRGGAGLIVACLGIEDCSCVSGLRYVDRGYENIEEVFASLGAIISADR